MKTMAIHLIPVVIGFGLAALFARCSGDNRVTGRRLKPDEPADFPDDGGRSDLGYIQPPPDLGADACIPDPCDGVVDPRVSREEYGREVLCLSFAEVSSALGLIGSGNYRRLRMIDFDQDGQPDLHFLKEGSADQLLRNTGGGFENAAAGLALTANSRDAAWKDADGDGDLDVIIAGEEGSDLYFQGPDGRFAASGQMANAEFGTAAAWLEEKVLLGTENGLRLLLSGEENDFPAARDRAWVAGFVDPGEASVLAAADYDGDGNEDVYAANSPGQDRLYRNRGDTTFESVEESLGMGSLGNSIHAAWVSFEGERFPSLYVSSWDGSNFQYLNNQDGTFSEISAKRGLRDPGRTTVSAWGDFLQNIEETDEADRRPSGYLGRDGEPNVLFIPVLDENGEVLHYLETALPLGMAIEATTLDAAWFDHNSDGWLDLAAVTYEGGLYLFENRTHPVFTCPKEAIP